MNMTGKYYLGVNMEEDIFPFLHGLACNWETDPFFYQLWIG